MGRCLVLACLLASAPAGPVVAAEVKAGPAGICDVRMSGPINPGDAERVGKALKRARDQGKSPALCLDSPGGDLAEAARLVQMLREGGTLVGTVVAAGDTCEGECGFVFMGGRYSEFHEVHGPGRTLHVNGRLGLRLPPFTGGVAPTRVAAYRASVDRFAAVLKLEQAASMPDPLRTFPRYLLQQLGAAPRETFWVRTLDHAARLGIALVGYTNPVRLTRADLRRACLNVGLWLGHWKTEQPFVPGADETRPIPAGRYEADFKTLGPDSDVRCATDAYRHRQKGWFILTRLSAQGHDPVGHAMDSLVSDSDGGSASGAAINLVMTTASWAVLPATTLIRDLR